MVEWYRCESVIEKVMGFAWRVVKDGGLRWSPKHHTHHVELVVV